MEDRTMAQGQQPPNQPQSNQPFVAREERPEVRLNPDMPVSEMRVRDLAELLSASAAAKSVAQEATLKKLEIKDHKFEKWEHKYEKWEHKFEHKELKLEIKEYKLEKFEHKDPLIEVIKREPEGLPDPRQIDPRIDELVKVVSQLASDVADLKGRLGKG
jgi:hypothetical protein